MPPVNPAASAWRRALQRGLNVGATLLVLLVVLHLPLDLLNRTPGVLLYLRPWDLFKDTCLLVLLYAISAAIVGAVAALGAALIDPLGRKHAERWIALWILLCWVIVGVGVLALGMVWAKSVRASMGVPLYLGKFKFVVLAAVAGWVIWQFYKRGLTGVAAALSARVDNGRGLTVVVLVAALVVVLLTGHAAIRGFGWSDAERPVADGKQHPNVILVVIDTVAAQDMSVYGYPLDTTPRLAAFAAQSYVFDNFFSAGNFTTASMASLLSGRDVLSHKIYGYDGRLDPDDRAHTLPQVLRDGGYTTGAAVANPLAHPLNTRMDDGFDYLSGMLTRVPAGDLNALIALHDAKVWPTLRDDWWNGFLLQMLRWNPSPSLQRENPYPPSLVQNQADHFLEKAGSPFFMWTHYVPPHLPYLSPAPFQGRFLPAGRLDTWREQMLAPGTSGSYDTNTTQDDVDALRLRYDEALAYADDGVGQLLAALERSGRLNDSIVVITSDHGESFEHGFQGHSGPLLYNGLVHVPLIIHLPGQTQGKRIANYAGHVDVLPTLLELAGLSVPSWTDGRSLVPLLEGRELEERPQLSMYLQPSSRWAAPRAGTLAIMARPYKLVRYLGGPCEELYDLDADPHERNNLAPASTEVVDHLRAELARRTQLELPAPVDRKQTCNPLGNVGSSGQ